MGKNMGSAEDASAAAPQENIRLSESFSLWPHLWVRSAGFAIDEILKLAAPGLEQPVDALLAAETTSKAALEAALEALSKLAESPEHEKAASKARRKLRKGTIPLDSEALGSARAAIALVRESDELRRSRLDALETMYANSERETANVLAQVASMPLLEEAMVWQNLTAAEIVLPRVRDTERKLNSMQRQRLQAVASYLQRYCTKNDTIGFFGPICWGRVVEGEGVCNHGDPLLSHREVFLAGWAVEALGAKFSEDPELKPHLCPRRMPTVAVDEDVLHYGVGESTEAPLEVVWLLEHCTGETSANELARKALAIEEFEFEDESEVFSLLEELEEQELLVWRLQVAPINPYPERSLRAQLERLGKAGERPLSKLSELMDDRDQLAKAAGNPGATAKALRAINSSFERIAEISANRNAGQTYGARTIVFEDCARNLELRLPQKLIEGIGPALSLLLQSSRWSTWEIAKKYRAQFEESFDALEGENVRYTVFLKAIQEHLPKHDSRDEKGIVGTVVRELRDRWSEILLASSDEGHRIDLRSEDIAEQVALAFDAPQPGWPTAQFASPDLMLATSDVLSQEAPLFVLGEFNPGGNYVFSNAITPPFCDVASEAQSAFEATVSGLAQTVYEGGGRSMNRLTVATDDVSVESGATLAEHPRSQVLAIVDLFVERRGKSLVVVDSESGRSFDIIAFHSGLFWEPLCTAFGFVRSQTHAPRITIDNVVVSRESWCFGTADFSFSQESKAHLRYAGAQRWRRKHKLPRLIFARLDSERKPVYIDLESPILVEAFCNLLRNSSDIKVSEMLPAPEQFWLKSPQGERYASELRTVAVDSVSWKPPV